VLADFKTLLDQNHTQCPVYRAPTWSWASIDGGIITYDFYRSKVGENPELLSNVLDVTVLPMRQDLFGQLRGGVLTLGCLGMLPAKTGGLTYTADSFRFPSTDTDDTMEKQYDLSDGSVKLVPILRSENGSNLIGLVLRATRLKKGEFERIGTFVEEGSDPYWQKGALYSALQESGQSIAREYCTETRKSLASGMEQYVITIV